MNAHQTEFFENWQKRRLGKNVQDYTQRVCQSLHFCAWCEKDITLGQEYRDCGTVRLHEECAHTVDALRLREALIEIDSCE